MQEFAPKPHTNDVNRLFHGFVRSVSNRASAGDSGAAANVAGQQATSIGAAITQSFAEQGGYIPITGKRPADFEAGYDDSTPSSDEIVAFLQSWGLDPSCATALEGQNPEVQRRVLDQFKPRPGTRDIRSLYFGFIKSVAAGGFKRPRSDSEFAGPQDLQGEELIAAT